MQTRPALQGTDMSDVTKTDTPKTPKAAAPRKEYVRAVDGDIELQLRHVDPGDLRARFPLFHRPLLVAPDLKVPATIRVMKRWRRSCSPAAPRS